VLFRSEGEEVVVTEKVNGQNARYARVNDVDYCGSHYNWKARDPKDPWWIVLTKTPCIQRFILENPGVIIYGENHGKVKNWKYGVTEGEEFIAFDIYKDGKFLDYEDFHAQCTKYSIPMVPLIYMGPYYKDEIYKLANGDSPLAESRGVKQIREGVVISPIAERYDSHVGRVKLKLVSEEYLAKKHN
jgi:RNA ligase (TIGR02306 family)